MELKVTCEIPIDVAENNGENAKISIKLVEVTMEQAKQVGNMLNEIKEMFESVFRGSD